MAAMNKTQIKFFCERAQVAENRAVMDYREKYPQLSPPSTEECAAAIYNGQARFKIERFQTERGCPRVPSGNPRDVLTFLFEIPDEELTHQKNERINRLHGNFRARVRKKRERLEDDFVMKEIADPREHLEWLSDYRNHIVESEVQELEKLTGARP